MEVRRKPAAKGALMRLGGMAIIWVLMVGTGSAWAAIPTIGDPEAEYDVTYQVNFFETQTLNAVKLADVVTMGSKEFLVIRRLVLKQEVTGFVDLEKVVAIIPQGIPLERTRHPATGPILPESPPQE